MIYLPEIAVYGVQRELHRAGKLRSLARVAHLRTVLPYLALSTAMWDRAAELWAQARNAGHLTASPAALDGDVLLAAQAESVRATVITTNVRHLEFFGPASRWEDFPP